MGRRGKKDSKILKIAVESRKENLYSRDRINFQEKGKENEKENNKKKIQETSGLCLNASQKCIQFIFPLSLTFALGAMFMFTPPGLKVIACWRDCFHLTLLHFLPLNLWKWKPSAPLTLFLPCQRAIFILLSVWSLLAQFWTQWRSCTFSLQLNLSDSQENAYVFMFVLRLSTFKNMNSHSHPHLSKSSFSGFSRFSFARWLYVSVCLLFARDLNSSQRLQTPNTIHSLHKIACHAIKIASGMAHNEQTTTNKKKLQQQFFIYECWIFMHEGERGNENEWVSENELLRGKAKIHLDLRIYVRWNGMK